MTQFKTTFLPFFIALIGALMLLATPLQAQLPSADGSLNVPAQLLSERDDPEAGKTVTLAFLFTPKPGWHGYWENPGDAGVGMTVDWTLPEGASVGKLRYPVPETLLIGGLMNYVYEGRHAVLVDLTLGENLQAGQDLSMGAKANWLSCTDEICVPEGDELSIILTVGAGAKEKSLTNSEFDGFRAALPRPLGSEAVFAVSDDRVRLSIPFPQNGEVEEPYFFPATDGIFDYAAKQSFFRDGNRLLVEADATGDLDALTGILKIGPHEGLSISAKKGAVEGDGVPIAGTSAPTAPMGMGMKGILLALGGAILGGLLLNIMPCVFPILSLKALSLAKAGGDEQSAKKDALAYSAGVIMTCIALGGALLALRSGGTAMGWAFQLQDPRIILILLLLVTAISLNLAGLFEIPSLSFGNELAAKKGGAGSFWTGALAAFIATPCAGPFMATALGAAILLPPLPALMIFAGLGLGLALPFLLVGFVPAVRNALPKPGPWMERFRRIMSIPMFLTALALFWLLERQLGGTGFVFALVIALTVGALLWLLGREQRKGLTARWPAMAAGAVSLFAAFLILPTVAGDGRTVAPDGANGDGTELMASERFSEERLAELQAEGRPVFAYFTADWCITCKANEQVAIKREETAAAFKRSNVAVLVGDWTRPDATISRFLEKHGRAGVPLYLYYAPEKDVVIMPQILTVTMLTTMVAQS